MTAARAFLQAGPPPARIAVFRALQLGDMLCAVPALRALRRAAPQSHITLIGMPWAASFVQRFGRYIDDLLVLPGLPGFPEQPEDIGAMPRFLEEAQRRSFDLVIQMHGSGRLSNPVAALFGGKRIAGYYEPEQHCPDPALFLPWQAEEHEVLRFLRLAEHLGCASQGEALEFPLRNADYVSLRASCERLPVPGAYACVHPGARLPSRRWPPQRFAEVADRLAAEGLQVVLTGSGDERAIVDAVKNAMRAPALDLCGRTDLGALAVLIAQARLLVSNDTGISHLAAAMATPSVIVCCGSDPRRWAPLDSARHRVIGAKVACRPCMHPVCPTGHECAQAVDAATVSLIAADVLSNHGAGVSP